MDFNYDNVRQVVEEDRLSNLPDELIHKILSSFDMKFAVKTCVLSSRWEFLWTSMPCLNFSSRQFGYLPKFAKFVTHVLSHRNDQVEVFSVKLDVHGISSLAFVEEIANYASSHNVQELTVVNSYSRSQVYHLTMFLMTCNSVQHHTPNEIPLDFPALTTLNLSNVRLCGDIFNKCVNSKNLTLRCFHIKGREVLDIVTPQLSNLTLMDGSCSQGINLNAPQLENLTINNCAIEYLNAPPGLSSFCYTASSFWSCYLLHFSNDGFHSLNKVTISLFNYRSTMPYKKKDALKTIKLLKALGSVRYLTLGADVVECISSFPDLLLNCPSPLSNLICLSIDCSMRKKDAYKVKMSTEAKNFLLENSPSATFIMESPKPAAGTAIIGKDVVICKYPADPTVALGYLSFGFLVASTIAGGLSLFYPYKGKSIPWPALFQSTTFFIFFLIALGSTGLAAAMLLWPTITEHKHLVSNVHYNLETTCPTAKTGLLGGGAFVALDAALFWLVSLMLADNAREDYFDDVKGTDGDGVTNGNEVDGVVNGSA